MSLPRYLFHGSRVKNIQQLKASAYSHDSAHRIAVYLTESLDVASCYGNEIYTVELLGDPTLSLDTTKVLSHKKKSQVLEAMLSIDPDISIDSLNRQSSADEIFDEVRGHLRVELGLYDTSLINGALLECGIWMIYGYMHPMAVSGLMDRGIQYALLDPSKSRIVSVSDYESIWSNATESERQRWRV